MSCRAFSECYARLCSGPRRRFRAFLHHCETEGFPAVSQRLGRSAEAYAAGYLSFIHMVNPEQEERLRLKHPWLRRWSEER